MRKFGKLCVFLCAFANAFCADTPTPPANALNVLNEASAPFSTSKRKKTDEYIASTEEGARSALEAGMPALAQAIVEDAVAIENLPSKTEKRLMLILTDAMIAQGKFETALRIMSDADKDDVLNMIRLALINAGLSNKEDAIKVLGKIDVSKVPQHALPWYYIAKGYTEYELGNMKKALDYFKKAKSSTASRFALADITLAENFCKLSEAESNTTMTSGLEKSLKEKCDLYFGTPSGFQFAKQYAALLFKLGKRVEAFEVLNNQLEIELSDEVDKDEIRIIAAAMTKDPELQLTMLREILRSTMSNDVCDFAVAILAKNPEISNEDRKAFLKELLDKGSKIIRDRILIELANASIKSYDRPEAAKYATQLVEESPASNYKKDALRVLAWTAFTSDSQKEAEYRLAATYLIALADIETDKNKADRMRLHAADCYFLNKDYATAAKLYQKLFSELKEKRGLILNRIVEANLNNNNETEAIKFLDNAYYIHDIKGDDIWNAEWKIISRQRANGESERARQRIEHAINTATSKTLLVKMRWLLARVAEESGDTKKAIELCDKIITDISNDKSSDKQTRSLVAANALLMKARCMESMNKIDEAFDEYKKLRETYPNSDAAKVSYLYQARTESKRGNYAAAQHLCRTLVENDPKGEHVYDAVSDAAKYASKLGSDADYKSALSMLDKLCADFPNNPRNFYARLSQAEILRQINAFADARKLYEEIINNYPKHPEIHLAWLGIGDCVLAQRSKSLNAATIFERIYALPDMPVAVKAEAAFKCAFALERAERTHEANEMRWGMSNRLLLMSPLTPSAKYWIGRNLFTLAQNLEMSGAKRDAQAAYEMIVKYKLPSYSAAEAKLKKQKN